MQYVRALNDSWTGITTSNHYKCSNMHGHPFLIPKPLVSFTHSQPNYLSALSSYIHCKVYGQCCTSQVYSYYIKPLYFDL